MRAVRPSRLKFRDVFAHDVALGMRTAERQTRHPHRVINAAIEIACGVADGVQAFDGFGGVGLKHFHVLADMHAGDDGRHANLAVDAIERRGVDRGEPLAIFAEVFVFGLRAARAL